MRTEPNFCDTCDDAMDHEMQILILPKKGEGSPIDRASYALFSFFGLSFLSPSRHRLREGS